MKGKKIDLFLSNLLRRNCYFIKNKKEIKYFEKLKENFFLIFKTSKLLESKDYKHFNINLRSKLITFRKKKISNIELSYNCRSAQKKDLPSIIRICEQNPYGSRFEKDPSIPKKFLKVYRSIWLKNFFKKKKGRFSDCCS